MRKCGLILGWVIFPYALSGFFNQIVDASYLANTGWQLLLVVPCFEETAKYLAYRGMRYRYTVWVGIGFVIFEMAAKYTTGFMAIGTIDPMFALFKITTLFAALKHILFWAPVKLFDFKWWALPIAILFHAVWNAWAMLPSGPDAVPGSILAIFVIAFALVLFKEQKCDE